MEASTGFEIFVTIVEEGGISAAARRLDVPRPTLSRRLAALEAALGVRLLHRSTRRVVLTAAGEELYRRARRIVSDAREARQAVARLDGVPRGLLRVSVPEGSMLRDTFSRYLAAWPEVTLEVVITARHVDLIAEGFDVVLRAGVLAEPDLVARTVWSDRLMVFASPDWVARHGLPQSIAALSAHDCIRGFARGEVPRRTWPLLDGGEVVVRGRFTTNDLPLALAEGRAGRGPLLLPETIGRREGLVPILPDLVGGRTTLSLVYPSRRLLEPRVRAFVDLAAADLTEAIAAGRLGPQAVVP